jgi:CPA2 family monovalent cation:H+ antiporter-2
VALWQILVDVVVLLGVGALLGALFERARQSAIVGYLLAGAVLGPNGFNAVQSGDDVLAVSELGVALLLFAIGLEFSWERLRDMGRVALGSGAVQVVATVGAGAGIALLAGLGGGAAIATGAVCALSSTACVLRVLTAQGEVESVHGERSLGILLVQDMAVVPLVLVVSVLADGGSTAEIAWSLVRTAGIGLVLVGALFVLFNQVVPRLLASDAVSSNRDLPLLVAVVSGLGSSAAAHAVGVSPALGAFVAGMLLAESPFAVQVRADVSSLKTLLLTLFFTAVGMLTDPGWIASNAFLVGGVVALVVLGKTALVWLALRLFEARSQTALATGIGLAQIGEFSFVLAGIARGRLLDEDTFMLIVSTAVLTMVLTPYLVVNAPLLAARLVRAAPHSRRDESPAEERDLAIVIGYGPAGQAAAERIAELGTHVVVIDQNPSAAREARRIGYGAVTGDARYAEVLDHAGLARASFVIITVPGTDTAIHLVRYVRQHAPKVEVFVRARFHRALPQLAGAGAHVVIDEEQEVGVQIAEAYEARVRRSKGETEEAAAG